MKLALKPTSTITDSSNLPLYIRIHSNTYDGNNTPIFSILSIKPTEPFGPRLDYYCTQRGKRFGLDWKFIYKYPAPTIERRDRKRYLDITWTATPKQVTDTEYPGNALNDGAIIYVVNRRTSVDSETDDIERQVDMQRVQIQDGETKVWQKRDTNATWYMKADKTLQDARSEVAEMKNLIHKMESARLQLENQTAQVITRNAQLQAENGVLRQRMQLMGKFDHQVAPRQRQQMLGQHTKPYIAHTMTEQPQIIQQQHAGQNQLTTYSSAGRFTAQNAYPPVHYYQPPAIQDQGGVRHPDSRREATLTPTPENEDENKEE